MELQTRRKKREKENRIERIERKKFSVPGRSTTESTSTRAGKEASEESGRSAI
jgi:hypothetical protein